MRDAIEKIVNSAQGSMNDAADSQSVDLTVFKVGEAQTLLLSKMLERLDRVVHLLEERK